MGDANALVVCSDSGRGYSPADEGSDAFGQQDSLGVPANQQLQSRWGWFLLAQTAKLDEFPVHSGLRGIKDGILWKESLACLVSSTTSSITNNSVCLPKFSPPVN